MKNLVIYHNDNDGLCSAAIVNYFVDNCEFYPINYGFKVPWKKIEKADKVFMVDFGLQPFGDMVKLLNMKGKKLLWIDHHVTAIEDEKKSGQKFEGIREIGKAGCELTWQYFSDLPVPRTVTNMGRYDCWDLEYSKDVVPYHYGMLLKNLSPIDNIWKNLFDNDSYYEELDYNQILRDGQICLKYQQMRYNQYCRPFHFCMEWEGLKFIACNALNVSSMLFDGYFDESKCDAMMCFGWTGNCWTVSMYTTKKGIDVGHIAKKYGGGGHKNASGYQTNELPFPITGSKINQ